MFRENDKWTRQARSPSSSKDTVWDLHDLENTVKHTVQHFLSRLKIVTYQLSSQTSECMQIINTTQS